MEKIMNIDSINETLSSFKNIKAGVIGDACLDVYWFADMKKSELSRETPHFPLPIVKEEMSPGGASNVAANMAMLGADVYMMTVIGNDWRGRELIKQLESRNISTEYIIEDEKIVTPAYIKPIRQGISDVSYEDPRIDFTNINGINDELEYKILDAIIKMSNIVDVISVCDQLLDGICTEKVRKLLGNLGKQGKIIIVDSRDRIADYKNVIIKPNEVEAQSIATDIKINPEDIDSIQKTAELLMQRNNAPVVITLGKEGAWWQGLDEGHHIKGIEVESPIDIVGAGDSFNAAFSLSYATGLAGYKAVKIGTMASTITIKKIGTTGTASKEEILNLANRLL